MNNLKSINVSFETHQTQPPSGSSIQILDSSIQSLIRSWQRRQRWLHVFATSSSSTQHQQVMNNNAPWRNHLANFLQSNWVHLFSISLLIVDLIITILELSSSLVSPCHQQRVNKVEKLSLHWIGISILSLLSIKSMALLVGLGSSFFKHFGYVMDGVVTIVALFLEVFLERKGGSLLIVVSLWRVIRVVESVYELSDETIEAQIEGIVCQFEALKEENMRLLETIQEKAQGGFG
ncbi:hypothetical protein HN873_050155 [Arachis hypogaea]|uniref:Voltage-gated hydrogen channel 1 n=1 Tax=Arachis hypogaea TaxID=3818 RepID=A0A444WNI2_ARAHY|nr:Voltage-gated hydrogen channel [Arachis hypogaea]RYQ79069.1 hypothetical protein Ahy_Scaffold8g108555 [Arachis hypogaea]